MVLARDFDDRQTAPNDHNDERLASLDSIVTCSGFYTPNNNWVSLVEPSLPLKASKAARYCSASPNRQLLADGARCDPRRSSLLSSLELHSRQLANQVILINLAALIVNLVLAVVAFYLSFTNNSPSTTAFAADCILDFISCAIVLWRYYGDLSTVYVQAREQIACIYLGALFEISALAIIIKALSDIASGADYILQAAQADAQSCKLIYLASIATVACGIITVFKFSLFKVLRDNSILLDVINTLISTVFALSIVMSQSLINLDANFWYLDPILSLILALFMVLIGARVIQLNFNVLKPSYCLSPANHSSSLDGATIGNLCNCRTDRLERTNANYQTNLSLSLENQAKMCAWQRADYSSITSA